MAAIGHCKREGIYCFHPEFPQDTPSRWMQLLITGHTLHLLTDRADSTLSPHFGHKDLGVQAASFFEKTQESDLEVTDQKQSQATKGFDSNLHCKI